MTDARLQRLKPDTTHVVVLFHSSDNNSKENKSQIDLLPRSWLSIEDEKWFCYYPGQDMYSQVEQWSKENIEPDKHWSNYEVDILKEARSYNQGLQQLEKSNSEDETEASSQCESADENEQQTYNETESNIIDQLLKFNANSTRQVLADMTSFSQLAANNNLQDDIDSLTPSLRNSKKRTLSEDSSSSSASSKKAKGLSDFDTNTNDSTSSSIHIPSAQTQQVFYDSSSVNTNRGIYDSDSSSSSSSDFNNRITRSKLPFETVSVVLGKDTDDSNLNAPSTSNGRSRAKTRSKSCDPISRKKKKTEDFDIYAPSTSSNDIPRTRRKYTKRIKTDESGKPILTPTSQIRTRSKSCKPAPIENHTKPDVPVVTPSAPKAQTRGRRKSISVPVNKNKKANGTVANDTNSLPNSVTQPRTRRKSFSAESIKSKEIFLQNAKNALRPPGLFTPQTPRKKQNRNSDRTMLRCNCPPWNHVLEEIRKFENAIDVKFESIKNSLLHDFYTKINSLQNQVTSNGTFIINEPLFNRDLLPPLPARNLDEFLYFESQLFGSIEVVSAFRSYVLLHLNKVQTLHEAIKLIFPMLFSKSVQLLYSGFGRKTKRSSKMNFSGTQTYCILKELMLHRFYESTLKDFNSYVSRWLSNAGDREGGKRERQRRYTEGDLSQTRQSDL